MSSRMLRKLQGDGTVDVPDVTPKLEEDDDDDDNSIATARGARPRRPNLNPFDLLNRDSQSESEVKEDDDLGTESTRSQLVRQDTRKKRKKKTRRKNSKADTKSSEDNQEDEVERSVREVNKLLGDTLGRSDDAVTKTGAKSSSKTPEGALRSLLCIEYRKLNPENEMKKIFGSRVVQAEAARHHHHRRGGGRARPSARSSAHSVLVPKGNWPNGAKSEGLSMRFVESDAHGNQFFAFEHSPRYQAVQKLFFQAVESMFPENIVHLLNKHPFHIDSILQLSDMCKMGEDLQMATDLIERALYAMEAAFHPLFNLAVGTSRLDYRRQENRSFFIALFRHLNFVGSRACYHTALEFCKLLLSLDPEADPAGVLLMLDFYALKAEQYSWFIEVFEVSEKKRNLSQLPNWAYGLALAHFHLAQESANFDQADAMLQRALIAFPGVLLPLLDKCSIEAPGKVMHHKFFLDADINIPDGLQLLCRLYVGRSFYLWKQSDLLPWLGRNAEAVLTKVDSGDPVVADAAHKRRTRYQGVPRNVYRHVIMSDIRDAVTSLPKELSASPVMGYDPLPPPDSVNLYTKKSRQTRPDDDPSAVGVFFRSIMPNYNPNDVVQRDGEAAGGEGADGAAGNRDDLRTSVHSLYEALQVLLGNLHLPEVSEEGGTDSEGDSDDENNPNWE